MFGKKELHGCLAIRNLCALAAACLFFSALEDKFRISVRPCITFYVIEWD